MTQDELARTALVRRGLRREYRRVVWNLGEAGVALAAGVATGLGMAPLIVREGMEALRGDRC